MTALLANTRKPDITFHHNGKIDITARLAKQLNMKEGDVINIAEHYGEYLLYIQYKAAPPIGRHEASVHSTKKAKRYSNNFRCYSRNLTDAIRQAATATQQQPLRLAAGAPEQHANIGTAIPLITKKPL